MHLASKLGRSAAAGFTPRNCPESVLVGPALPHLRHLASSSCARARTPVAAEAAAAGVAAVVPAGEQPSALQAPGTALGMMASTAAGSHHQAAATARHQVAQAADGGHHAAHATAARRQGQRLPAAATAAPSAAAAAAAGLAQCSKQLVQRRTGSSRSQLPRGSCCPHH
jgi:hypothetical protein